MYVIELAGISQRDRQSRLRVNRDGHAVGFTSPHPPRIADMAELTLRAITGCKQSQQKAPLFDHLVGAGEERRRHVETECSSGFKINYQFERGRLLNW